MNAKERIERAEEHLRLAKEELAQSQHGPLFTALRNMNISEDFIVTSGNGGFESYKLNNTGIVIHSKTLANLPFRCHIGIRDGRIFVRQLE